MLQHRVNLDLFIVEKKEVLRVKTTTPEAKETIFTVMGCCSPRSI